VTGSWLTGDVDYDGRIAAVYEAARDLRPEAEQAWLDAVGGEVRAGDLVVDVGAGTGRFARRFSSELQARVVAVEPAEGMRTNRGRAVGAPVSWIAGSAEALPLRSRTVDVAWASYVLHYTDLRVAGGELARVLQVGGSVLVWSSFPDRFADVEWMRWFPSAVKIDAARLPSVERVQDAWKEWGLQLRRRQVVPIQTAANLTELAERIGRRGISTLELIPDAEFEAGLTAMRRHAASADETPVFTPVDLLVFRLSR